MKYPDVPGGSGKFRIQRRSGGHTLYADISGWPGIARNHGRYCAGMFLDQRQESGARLHDSRNRIPIPDVVPSVLRIRQTTLLLLMGCIGTLAFARDLKRPWLGVVVGAPLTADFQPLSGPAPPYTGEVKRRLDFPFVVGGMVEMPVARQFSLEVDGLYRRLRYPDDPSVVLTWEVPVLAKYTLSSRGGRPFVEGGPSFRLAGNLNSANPSHHGLTLGAGAGVRLRRLKIAPGIRYTYWAADGPPRVFPPALTRQHRLELLVGISF
jgi:hypothetical protein